MLIPPWPTIPRRSRSTVSKDGKELCTFATRCDYGVFEAELAFVVGTAPGGGCVGKVEGEESRTSIVAVRAGEGTVVPGGGRSNKR